MSNEEQIVNPFQAFTKGMAQEYSTAAQMAKKSGITELCTWENRHMRRVLLHHNNTVFPVRADS